MLEKKFNYLYKLNKRRIHYSKLVSKFGGKASGRMDKQKQDHPFTSVSMQPIITPLALPVTMQVTDIYLNNTGFGKAV
jgi:hypothetical protein